MLHDNVSTMDHMVHVVYDDVDEHDAVCCMIMFGVWVIWSMLSMMMLDDHNAVCCMIMFGVCYGWSMLSKMMLDDRDAV